MNREQERIFTEFLEEHGKTCVIAEPEDVRNLIAAILKIEKKSVFGPFSWDGQTFKVVA